MKVRVLHRQEGCGVPSGPGALQRLAANRDPRLHPFQKEREYSRALVATKLKKLFAKPFVAALEAHTDGVKAIAKSRTHPAVIFSSSCNGEVCAWNLAAKKCTANIKAHDGFARGLAVGPGDSFLLSCGDDKKIKQFKIKRESYLSLWDAEAAAELQRDEGLLQQLPAKNQLTCSGLDPHPVNVFMADSPVTSVDYHWNRHLFVSTGEAVQLWEPNRSVPLQTFSWASDGVYCAKFNPSETSLLAAGLSGNSIALYDIRGNTPIRRVLMKMKTNALSWNPQEPLNFTAANEDGCLYTFDLRRLSEASRVYKDFVNAVLDVDYSPTGQEFVAASFDGTLRIFKTQEGRSRDVYHTRRMQSVLSCGFSSDSRFVFSGSADMCIRVWKAAAAALLGPQNPRQRAAVNYRQTLVDKFAHLPEIRRIERHHHVPKLIKKTQEKKRIMREAAKRREDNRIAHSKPGTVKRVAERKKSIYREIE
ncbi:WD domain, G-beta repeat-containing protein, putative [Eimeria tenella]|uniref:WD domain, G-beta repeat-containing protein, putative n=1 Tax=Eimeria tenella TaxID=5802 RepID=U6KS12_EIMTE|nr:WD domain, G-beta repeat-containing protein, putative [Eimeria tenella]CDJ39149.1 WD domain, G-beta repeat-containing protein, putative [Eimeria tenella]|eukprot:XP_013229904.1 WD domain, G-beta repeat-containing protein, putative [Eimeria tenella]